MNMIIKTAISDASRTWLNYLTYLMNTWNEQNISITQVLLELPVNYYCSNDKFVCAANQKKAIELGGRIQKTMNEVKGMIKGKVGEEHTVNMDKEKL